VMVEPLINVVGPGKTFLSSFHLNKLEKARGVVWANEWGLGHFGIPETALTSNFVFLLHEM